MKTPYYALFLGTSILLTAGPATALGPEQIHLTWQNEPQTTMTVQWATGSDTTKGVLEYGITKGDYSKKIDATPITYSGATRKLFVAEATGLEPGTLYHYRVGDGSNAISKELTFATAPAADTEGTSAPFRFIAFGDSRGGYEIFGQAITRMLKDTPDLFVFTGDATVEGDEAEWDSWFLAGEQAMSSIPFMPTFGNHDALALNYFERFSLPKNAPAEDAELYYSFEYGNAKFIVLNDNYALAIRPSRLDGPEFAWFENELKTNRKQWLFVVNHQPFYSASNKHGSDVNLQRVWLPLIDKYKVDMVFNGHDHNYERSYPMRDNAVQATPSDGTIFVVAAGVGAPLYENGRKFHTAISESKESYVLVDIDGLTLNYTAKRLNGTVIETFSHTRQARVFASEVTPVTVKDRGVLQGPLWSCAGTKNSGSDVVGFLIAALPLLLLRKRKTALWPDSEAP